MTPLHAGQTGGGPWEAPAAGGTLQAPLRLASPPDAGRIRQSRRERRDPLLLGLAVATSAAALASTLVFGARGQDWAWFAALVTLGLIAQLRLAPADDDRSFHAAAVIVLTAAAILLPIELLVLAALVLAAPRCFGTQHVSWPDRAFQGASEVVTSAAAWAAAGAALAISSTFAPADTAETLAGAAACVAMTFATRLPRLVVMRLPGTETFDAAIPLAGLRTELLLSSLGAATAVAYLTNPWLVPFAVAPLFLVRRWLQIPWLEHQTRLDAKTTLFNARYFDTAMERELGRARTLNEPLSVLVADLDLLREINNAYGHLAGDAVLRGVGEILADNLRSIDIPARFGGEEFAVVLPGIERQRAVEIAERVRSVVAAARFRPAEDGPEIHATVSIGVATYPEDGTTALELVHLADLAVYRAKLQGRNRVLAAGFDPILDRPRHTVDPRLALGLSIADGPHQAQRPKADLLGRRWIVPAVAVASTALVFVALHDPAPASYATTLIPPLSGAVALLHVRRRAQRRTMAEVATVAQARAEHLWRAADSLHSQNISLERANRLLRERSAAAMETLSAAVDARDSHTAGHSRRVQKLALAIGRELGLSEAELEVLSHAARFHDVGKLAVPEAILLKPDGLDSSEWTVIRRHPDEGARLIERLGFLEDALPAIRHHHERYDGSGYPNGLAREEIPLGARIIHLADALDAMLTARVYRPALEPLDALSEIRRGEGTQFCPRCVEALDRVMLAEFADGANVPGELLAV